MSQKSQPQPKAESTSSFKAKFKHFFNRKEHTTDQNLRLAAIIPAIAIIIGLFLPFLSADFRLLFVNNSKSPAEETVLFQPEEDIIQFSAGDLVTHQPLRSFKIFGQAIGDLQILGINLYDLATTQMPSFDGLSSASASLSAIDTSVLSFLNNEQFKEFSAQYLGDFGNVLTELSQNLDEVLTNAGAILDNVAQVLSTLNAVSDSVRYAISQAESALSAVETVVLIIFLIALVAVILYIIKKGPRYLPAILLSIISFIFVVIGVAVLIINNVLDSTMATAMEGVSTSIQAALNGAVPGMTDVLAKLFSVDKMSFGIDINLVCRSGWWFITLSMLALTTLAYVAPALEKHKLAKQAK